MSLIDFVKEEGVFAEIFKRFEEELKKIRAGRANPAILEHILVESYGAKLPINNLAMISIVDQRSVVIKPWDKSNLPAIEAAIKKEGIGAGMVAEGDQVRIIFPPLTEERRRDLIKSVGRFAEETKIQLRQHRDEIWKTIQEQSRLGRISEDQKFSQKERMEKMVGEYNDKISGAAKKKEEELISCLFFLYTRHGGVNHGHVS